MQTPFDFKAKRLQNRQRRRSLGEDVVAKASHTVCEQLVQLPAFIQAKTVAIYYPIQGEISPLPLVSTFAEKNFVLPVTPEESKSLTFYRYAVDDVLVKGSFGIPEPQGLVENQVSLDQIDLMVVPVVAFDVNNNRMGQGAGYYDRTLADTQNRPTLIGLAYEWQRVPELPIRPWDVPMDGVIVG